MAAGAGEAVHSFLTFFLRDEPFALPLGEVREVIRMPALATVPRGPASLMGLANLRGTVLPVADLRRLLRWEGGEVTDSTRVLVVAPDVPCGLMVDRIGALVSVSPDRIEGPDSGAEAPDGQVLRGLIREGDEGTALPVLDLARLLRRDFTRPRSSPAPAPALAAGPAPPRAVAPAAEDARVLVSLVSNGQEYALPIEAVEEIVPVPGQVAAVPHADGRVLGIVAQRGRLLPLVPLRALLGWPAAEADAPRKVAVVRVDGATLIGLVVDRPGEILRVPASAVHPVPPLLTRGGRLEVGAICRLDEGRRLVSVLSPENLVRHDAVRQAIAAAVAEDTEMAQSDPGAMDGAAETEFVVFHLAGEEYAVPIGAVDEVLPLRELTRVPGAPAFIEGVMNLRGTVLPVVDQRRRFGLPAAPRTGRERVMVHAVGGVRAGFIVDSVARVLRVPQLSVGPAPELSRGEAPLVAGVVNPPGEDRLVLVLDVARLLDGEEAGALAGMEAAG